MNLRLAVALLSSLCLLLPVRVAAQSAAASRDPEAAALLSRSLQTITNGLPVRDVTLTGTVRRVVGSDDEAGRIVAEALATGEMHVNYAYASGSRNEFRQVSAGRASESWSGPEGTKHDVVAHNVAPLSPWFSPAALLQTWVQAADVSLKYVSREIRSGHAVDHLTVAQEVPPLHHPSVMLTLLQKSARVELYLDATTGLPAAIEYNTHSDKNLAQDIPVEIRFSDYRLADGVQAPYQVQKYLNRVRMLDVRASTVALNAGLSTSSLGPQ
jgi:hypothetical protein